MKKLKLYLDMCCFNRPYDNQTHLRIYYEAMTKLTLQSWIVDGKISFVWSYVLEFENAKNPFVEKQNTIAAFKQYASEIAVHSQIIDTAAEKLQKLGIKPFDALHIACAIHTGCNYFLTVDDKILKKQVQGIAITDPVAFVNDVLKGVIK